MEALRKRIATLERELAEIKMVNAQYVAIIENALEEAEYDQWINEKVSIYQITIKAGSYEIPICTLDGSSDLPKMDTIMKELNYMVGMFGESVVEVTKVEKMDEQGGVIVKCEFAYALMETLKKYDVKIMESSVDANHLIALVTGKEGFSFVESVEISNLGSETTQVYKIRAPFKIERRLTSKRQRSLSGGNFFERVIRPKASSLKKIMSRKSM